MPKPPICRPDHAGQCDPRLAQAALDYRRKEGLLEPAFLGAINITAWLYETPNGGTNVQVNPNVPIREVIRKFGAASTRDAEVGFHSEFIAAQWFIDQLRDQPTLRVLQIFSERIPCRQRCGPFLRMKYSGVPWYYYFDPETWKDGTGKRERRAADILRIVYGL